MASSQWWASSQVIDFFINIGLNNYVTLTIKDRGVLRPSMVSMSLVAILVPLWGHEWVVSLALDDFMDVQLNLPSIDWRSKPHDLS